MCAPSGYGSVLAAIPAAGVAFACLGFRNGVEFAGETDNPQRNVPFAIIGSILITAVIYVLLQIAFITALPGDLLAGGWSELTFAAGEAAGPLAGLSLVLGAVWLAVLLRVDAVISPADTGLIYAGVTTRLAYANARNGNAPHWLTKLNRRTRRAGTAARRRRRAARPAHGRLGRRSVQRCGLRVRDGDAAARAEGRGQHQPAAGGRAAPVPSRTCCC